MPRNDAKLLSPWYWPATGMWPNSDKLLTVSEWFFMRNDKRFTQQRCVSRGQPVASAGTRSSRSYIILCVATGYRTDRKPYGISYHGCHKFIVSCSGEHVCRKTIELNLNSNKIAKPIKNDIFWIESTFEVRIYYNMVFNRVGVRFTLQSILNLQTVRNCVREVDARLTK